ncbi:MAG: DUF2845 domain-containing protein [Burkholderiales bacterium]|nr:DUF2845 domain-containing protein [Burkholderiales bacterium]
MRTPHLLTLSMLAAFGAGSAHGESLRCAVGSVAEGDSRLAVLYKCGEPLARDGACAPVHYAGSLRRVPEPFASSLVPCVPTEEWLYERGPGNLVAMVRFRSGKVQSIQYGHVPR